MRSLRTVWLLAAAIAVVGCGGPGDRPNLVLISLDTCRADAVSYSGNPNAATPHLDALAESGIWFESAVSPVPITLPAHCSLMTGTEPPRHGVRDNLTNRLAEDAETLAEVLAGEGWRTAGFVSSYVLHRRFGFAQGFQDFNDDFSASRINVFGAERRGGKTVDLAVDWLQDVDQDPFFLFVHLYDPHEPYEPPEPFASRFAENPYLGEVAYADACVGRLIGALERLGLRESTVITVVGDHGEMLGEHGEMTHTYFIYRSAVRVPLLITGPAIPTGRKTDHLTGLVDMMPTLCDVLGVATPDSNRGTSVATLLSETPGVLPTPVVYCESLTPTRYGAAPLHGVVTPEYKLVESARPELYDVRSDPGEATNLAGDETEIVEELRRRIDVVLAGDLGASAPAATLNDEERQRLEALGYVAADTDRTTDSPTGHTVDATELVAVHVAHQRAIQHIAARDFSAAEPYCEEVLGRMPDFWEGVSNLAKVRVGQRRWTEAVPLLERADALHPGQYEILFDLGLAATEQGRLDDAVAHFQRALPHDPTPPAGALNLARALVAAGREDAAEAHLDTVLQSADAGSLEASAALLFEMGRLDDAAKHLAEALRLDPGRNAARLRLASVRLRQGRSAEATALFDEVVRSSGDPAAARHEVVDLLARAGRYDLAGRFVGGGPGEASTPDHESLGIAALSRGDAQVARRELESALSLEPNQPATLNALGLACALTGDLETARRHFERVLELDPAWAGAHLNLGMVALNTLPGPRGLESAVTHFEKAITLDPAMAEAHANLGLAWLRLDRTADAVASLQRSLDLAPDQPSTLDQLAWLCATSEDPAVRDPVAAVELARQACALTSRRQPELLATLAVAVKAAGQSEHAATVANEALKKARQQAHPDTVRRLEAELRDITGETPQ